MDGNKIATYVVYIISLIILYVAMYAEHKDLHCPTPYAPESECGSFGRGMAYDGSKPEPGDSDGILLDKIERASYTEELTVKWRRTYALSFLIVWGIWLFVVYPTVSRLPNWSEYILSLFISGMIIYLSFSYYGFHHYSSPSTFIRQSTNDLRESLNLKRSKPLEVYNH